MRYWKDRAYDDYHVILLTKSIEVMAEIIRGGVPVRELNLGGIPQKPGLTSIIKEVAINKEQLKLLQELQSEYDIDIYFQAIPSSRRVSLKEAAKLFEEHS